MSNDNDMNHRQFFAVNNTQTKIIFYKINPEIKIPELWIYDMENGGQKRLAEKGSSLPLFQENWSLDDKCYYFNRSHGFDQDIYDDHLDIHRIDVETQEITQITDNDDFEIGAGFISDNKLLMVSNKKKTFNYYLYDVESKEYEQLTDFPDNAFQFKYEYLKSKINKNRDKFSYCIGKELCIYDFNTSDTKKIGVDFPVIDLGWIDDEQVMVQSQSNHKFYKININNNDCHELKNIKLPCSYETTTNNSLIFSKFGTHTNGGIYLDFYSLDGEFQESLSYESTSVTSQGMRPMQNFNNETLYFALSAFDKKPTINKYDVETKNLTPYMHSDEDSSIEVVYKSYKSGNDRNIYIYIVKPKNGNETHPVIIIPHGGPVMKHMNRYSQPEIEMYVKKGYVVVLPNYSGSTGYGKEFQDLLRIDHEGGFGKYEIEDMDYLIEELSKYPYVDESQINFLGISYGGYMAFLHSVKGKNRDKVNTYIPITGITSWNLYHNEDIAKKYKIAYLSQKIRMQRNFLPNVFVEDEDEKKKAFKLLEEISPITYIENLQRPMSIIQYIEDERTPIEQARTFVQKLNDIHSNNIPFKFSYKELQSNHMNNLSVDTIDEILSFMSSSRNEYNYRTDDKICLKCGALAKGHFIPNKHDLNKWFPKCLIKN